MKCSKLLLAFAGIFFATSSQAAVLDFTWRFFGDVIANGNPETVEEVVITGSGDTSNILFNGVSRYELALDTFSVNLQGTDLTPSEPISLVRSGGTLALIETGGSSFFSMSPGLVSFPDLASFNLASDFSFDYIDGVQCCSMNGTFSLADGTSLTSFSAVNSPVAFSATVSDVDPVSEVPLPASALLLLAGMGGLAALRRKS